MVFNVERWKKQFLLGPILYFHLHLDSFLQQSFFNCLKNWISFLITNQKLFETDLSFSWGWSCALNIFRRKNCQQFLVQFCAQLSEQDWFKFFILCFMKLSLKLASLTPHRLLKSALNRAKNPARHLISYKHPKVIYVEGVKL